MAHIPADADRIIELDIHQRAAVEAVRSQGPAGVALRAVVRPITVWVRNLSQILLDDEWICTDLLSGVADSPISIWRRVLTHWKDERELSDCVHSTP
jgi:hypothetical protein